LLEGDPGERMWAVQHEAMPAILQKRLFWRAKAVSPAMDTPTLLDEAKEAFERTMASQLGALVRDSLVATVGRTEGKLGEKIQELLRRDLGKSLSMAALSVGLQMTTGRCPQPWQPALEATSRELRIGALALVGDELADLVTAPLREVLVSLLGARPDEVLHVLPRTSESFQAPSRSRETVLETPA
jgi:hypothetical protein